MHTTKPLSFFWPDPNQPRKHFDEAALLPLGESLKIHQNDPVQAKPDGMLIDGERRWRAGKLVGLEKLETIITDAALTDTQISVIRLTSFFHREGLTAWEKWNACRRLMELNSGWQNKDLAAHLHIDPSMVTRLLCLSKCIEPAQIALRENKIGISHCYEFCRESPQRQEEMLRMLLAGGSSRKAVREARLRKCGNAEAAAVKPSPAKPARIPIRLPGGVSVVITANELSLDNVVEISSELQQCATIAREEGLSVKAWIAAMKDRAKAKDRKPPT